MNDDTELDFCSWTDEFNRQEMRAKATFAAGFMLAIVSGAVLLATVFWSGAIEATVANSLISIATCWGR